MKRTVSNTRCGCNPGQLLCVAVLLSLSWFPIAGDSHAEESGSKGKQPDYRKLVQGLVSANKPPTVYDEDRVRYPEHYDAAAQRQIEKNRHMLYVHCSDALPFLIEGSTDSRYSLT